MVPNLKAKYNADVAPALMKKFQYKSTMQIPTIDKIVINVGCGKEANGNSKAVSYTHLDVYKRQPPRRPASRWPSSSRALSPMPRTTTA